MNVDRSEATSKVGVVADQINCKKVEIWEFLVLL